MKHVHLATIIGYLRGRQSRRFSSLPLAALILGFGTSAIAQDIRSFGARCDGSDDSGALNAAFAALPNGGTLHLSCPLGIGPSGILLHSKQGVTIDGSGGRLIGLANNHAKILFRVEACSGCSIRNLNIEGNNVGAAGVSIYWSNDSTIENTTVTNAGYPAPAGIIGMGNRGNRYLNNTVAGTTGNAGDGTRGIWAGNPSSSLIEWNPTISNNAVRDIAATGIVLHTAGAMVTNNVVERAQGAGIKVEPWAGSGPIVIEGNTLRNNLFHGVQIYRADSPVLIRNNTIASNTMAGVLSSGGAFNNGQISGNHFSDNGQAAIYLYDGRGLNIQGNQISSGGNGIIFEAGPSSSLGGVQVTSNTISGVSGDGIIVRGRGGSFSDLAVSSNSLTNNGRYGMSVEETNAGAITGVSLSGNCFSGNRVGALLDLRLWNVLSGIGSSSNCSTASAPPPPAPAPAPTPAPAPAPTPAPAPEPSPVTQQQQQQVTTNTQPSSSAMTPIRVNAGGGQYTDTQGNVWMADFGGSGGYSYVVNTNIANTAEQRLYQAVRWHDRVLDYSFSVPAGTRTVILRFSETYFGSPGQRIFDISINGQKVLSNFDIVAEGGANTAVDKSFQVQSSGQISIHMVSSVDDPVISAIEIR
jgi:parallel beta-helix repeat protein